MKTETILFDPKWIQSGELVICSVAEAKQKKVWPNRLGWRKSDPSKLGLEIVFQSHRGEDFPIGKNGLDYIKAAKKEGRSKEVCVLLLRYGSDGQPQYVAHMTIEEVETALSNCRPSGGELGLYWWWSTPSDSEVPF